LAIDDIKPIQSKSAQNREGGLLSFSEALIRARKSLIYFLLIFMIIAPIFDAKTGYGINVLVHDSNSSSFWGRSLTTNELIFTAESKCTGSGNSSKYVSISDFAGIDLKESAYSKQGRLIEKNLMGLTSKMGWVHIEERGTDNSNTYTANLNVSMPTILYSTDDLYYRGNGMNARSEYRNGETKFEIDHYGSSLTKSVKYGATFNDSKVQAIVTPNSIYENANENRTIAFRLTSASNKYTGLELSSEDEFIEQIYRGDFKVDAKIIKVNKFVILNNTQNEMQWLPCGLDNSAESMNQVVRS